MTTLPPELLFEKTMYRSGLQPCGGSITRRPCHETRGADSQGLQSWGNRFAGLFVVNKREPGPFDSEMTALRDVIACGSNDSSIEVSAGPATFQAQGSILNVVYMPRGTHVRFSTGSSAGVRSVTIMLDVHSFMESQGISPSQLPWPLCDMIARNECAMEQVGPCHAVTRIVDDIILRRGMHPTLPALFLESKTLELMSSWLCHLGHLETDPHPGRPTVNQRTRTRVALVKEMLDRTPALALNMESLEKAAAMNRTKLRAAFKEMYGMTLVQYRTAVSMRRAEQLLGEAGATVQQAAHLAGYANASSFIVAFKRYFGVSPGDLPRKSSSHPAPIGHPLSRSL